MASRGALLLLAGVFLLVGVLSLGFVDSYAVSSAAFEDECGSGRSVFFNMGSGRDNLLVPPLLSVTQPGLPEFVFGGGLEGTSSGDPNSPCTKMKECDDPMSVGENCVKCMKKKKTEEDAKKFCKVWCKDNRMDWTNAEKCQCRAGV